MTRDDRVNKILIALQRIDRGKNDITGSDLRDLRKEFDWTQEQMSGILEVDQSQVSRWERDVAPVPKWAIKLLRLHCKQILKREKR